MLALVLAAAVTLEQALVGIDDFFTKAEIDVAHPVTQQMLTKTHTKLDRGIVLVRVNDRYRIDFFRGKVRAFNDLRDDGKDKLGRLDPNEMKQWSEQPCLIDETGAREIARRIFLRLGFEERDFDPVEVHRYSWQPTEADPDHKLRLPLFHVIWYQKGHSRDQAVPPSILMNISGTTKRLVYYSDCTRHGQAALLSIRTKQMTDAPALVADTNAQAICAAFFKAAGISPATNWMQRTHLSNTPTDPAVTATITIDDRYVFKLRKKLVHEFYDRQQWPFVVHVEGRSAELSRWAGKPAAITETQAVQLAGRVLSNLGFDKQQFRITEVQPDVPQITDPDRPGNTLSLPTFYRIQWVGQRPWWARHGMPDVIRMEISGANGELVHYWHAPNNYRFWPTPMMKWLVLIPLVAAAGLWILRWSVRNRHDSN
jgi:hypothetical protein